MLTAPENNPVLLFDGVCNLCNKAVQFILKHERNHQLRFASLQSPYGRQIHQKLLRETGIIPDSLILYYEGQFYLKSSAVLQIAKLIGTKWFYNLGFLMPLFMCDALYDLVARNRYKWFGKMDECMLPTPSLAERFVN